MEPLNIGADVLIRIPGENWQPICEAYMTEGTTYEWLLHRTDVHNLSFASIPLTFKRADGGIHGNLVTPFQSGEVKFNVDEKSFTTFLYPDSRKMTESQYEQMLSDVLDEAAVCYQYSGSTRALDVSGFQRGMSWPQWKYITSSFSSLKMIISKLSDRPYRILHSRTEFVKREKVKVMSPHAERWLEQSYGKGKKEGIPDQIQTSVRKEAIDVYENQFIKSQLKDLERLLLGYCECGYEQVESEANCFLSRVRYWLRHTFLKEVSNLKGNRVITQVIRKNPVYRMTHQWFDRLNHHGQHKIGFAYSMPLKDTFDLYEMWCYFQIIKSLRKYGFIEDTSALYRFESDGIFLDLSVNHGSTVRLKNQWKVSFQRVYQSNSPAFFTYTHRMVPDIVIEGEESIVIFDPKYRVPSNLSNALGEMHKYRDGILAKQTEKPAVKEVYILTPWQENQELLKFFESDYHHRYQMGAVAMNPGEKQEWLDRWIVETFGEAGALCE
ncbi:DUF2357 domain-containing protein [Alteribacter populi]|uniref:DUF2357 domain-containing protein n=1 Tax=Alteribacter populi TaxID=2011011 RepID=UPI000BBA667F|nr:DUF2357 domain-containing protein [Alteribacter populi]